jgi:hypothetical protein
MNNSMLLLANQIQKFLRMVRVSLKYHEPKPIISKIQLQIKQDFLTSQEKKNLVTNYSLSNTAHFMDL